MIRVLAVAGALLVIAQLHRAGGGVISSELNRTFGLGGAEIGVVIGIMSLASALAQLPMGLAFDRFGTRRTAAALALVALAGTLVFASAGSGFGLAPVRGGRVGGREPAWRTARHRTARLRPAAPWLDPHLRRDRAAHPARRRARRRRGARFTGSRHRAYARRREPGREHARTTRDSRRSRPAPAPDHGRVHHRAVRL